MTNTRHCDYMGKAAEYAVASQLLLRGMPILWPVPDMGYDLLTMSNCRVQVKSSHIDGHSKDGQGYYWFPLSKTRQVVRKNQAVRVPVPDITKICDAVVFWGIEENRFWVAPSGLCTSHAVELGLPNPKRFVGSIKDMRDMISLGYTRGKVARHFGITRHAVQLFLDSGRDFVDETVTSKMRACENRWDYILEFVRTATAVDVPAQVQEE